MSIDTIHIGLQALALTGAAITLLYSMLGDKVSRWRKPLYWVALPVVGMLALTYIDVFMNRVFNLVLPGLQQTGLLVRVSLFLITSLFYLVPYVDRLEHRTSAQLGVIGAESERIKNELMSEQEDVIGEQRTVMGEQRGVMDSQKQGLAEDERLRKDVT